ncbi:hypothetical protein LEP1GSC137_0375 [Leptospira borgpetersenii str. Noumea 25]|nr:hypothetical protein LEP1GSC137_0375 [Leptospira borgpetersenii str. Noumea 25]
MRQEDSLFESGNFLDFSGSEESETLADSNGDITSTDDVAPTADGYSSLSSEEKERIRKEIIQKVKLLAERFPDNSLIPRELTEENEKKTRRKWIKFAEFCWKEGKSPNPRWNFIWILKSKKRTI